MNTKVREAKSAALLRMASLLQLQLRHLHGDKEGGKKLIRYYVLSVLW